MLESRPLFSETQFLRSVPLHNSYLFQDFIRWYLDDAYVASLSEILLCCANPKKSVYKITYVHRIIQSRFLISLKKMALRGSRDSKNLNFEDIDIKSNLIYMNNGINASINASERTTNTYTLRTTSAVLAFFFRKCTEVGPVRFVSKITRTFPLVCY